MYHDYFKFLAELPLALSIRTKERAVIINPISITRWKLINEICK